MQDLCSCSTEIQQALQQTSIPFKVGRSSDIIPVHCRKALNVLEDLRERLAEFRQSLSQSDSLALMLAPSRYPVLIALCNADKHASLLMDQLDSYRLSCLGPSRHHLFAQRREILALFDKVIRQVEDLPDLALSLEREREATGNE